MKHWFGSCGSWARNVITVSNGLLKQFYDFTLHMQLNYAYGYLVRLWLLEQLIFWLWTIKKSALLLSRIAWTLHLNKPDTSNIPTNHAMRVISKIQLFCNKFIHWPKVKVSLVVIYWWKHQLPSTLQFNLSTDKLVIASWIW